MTKRESTIGPWLNPTRKDAVYFTAQGLEGQDANKMDDVARFDSLAEEPRFSKAYLERHEYEPLDFD